MTLSKEAIEAAARIIDPEAWKAIEDGRDALPGALWGIRRDGAKRTAAAVAEFLSTLPIAGEDIETATLKERLRAATVARKAAREALEKGFLNRIPDRVFDAVHEASSFPPNLDAADARSSTLEQKLKVATEALENIQQTRCDHDMGFDREIGPLGCSLGDKCVCVGLCTIASQALLETSALSAPYSPGKDGGQEVEAVELSGVSKELEDGSGFWRSCSGCHNLNEGVPTGPYSSIMKCHLGFGCRECGGIGAIWDNVDYSDFGLHEINEAQP